MRQSVIMAAIVLTSVATGGCGRTSTKESKNADGGPTISRSYQVGNFQAIEAAGPYDVVVRTGVNPGVSAKGPQDLLDRAIVEVQGDKLVIREKERSTRVYVGYHSNTDPVFTVTMPQLHSVLVAGSGDMKVDAVRGDQFVGTLTGSGNLAVGSIDVHALKVSMAGSGNADLGSGRVQTASYEVVGEGNLEGSRIETQQLKAGIAGSGNVEAHATGTAAISIAGEGNVVVTGGAKCSVIKAGEGEAQCS